MRVEVIPKRRESLPHLFDICFYTLKDEKEACDCLPYKRRMFVIALFVIMGKKGSLYFFALNLCPHKRMGEG